MRRFGLSLAVALWASGAAATPADLLGFGPRSQALAGTGAAVGEGFEATYGNPAGLSRTRHRELTVGFQELDYGLTAEGPNAPGDVSAEAASGTFIGAVMPLPFGGVLQDRISVGLGAYTPRSLIVRARLLYPERGQFPVITDRAQSIDLAVGLGVDVGYGLRAGVGFLALAELVGTAVVRTDSSGRIGTVVDDQLIAAYAPVGGLTWEATDQLTLGAAWRGELIAEFDVVVQVYDLGQLVIPDLHISGVAQYDPGQLQLEAAWREGEWLLVGGFTGKRWSAFEGWAQATVRCPESRPDCAALTPPDPGFSDTVVPRLAVERSLALARGVTGKARGGAFYEPSPVPEQTGASNYWDNDRVALTAGWGLSLAEPLPPLDVSLFYQHHFLLPRRHEKVGNPTCATGVGCVPDAGAPHVETGGWMANLGVTLGVRF